MFSAPSTFPTKTDATRFLAVVEADIARGLCIDGLIPEAVDLRSKVAAPSTVARDFSALRAVLNAAVNAELIARSGTSLAGLRSCLGLWCPLLLLLTGIRVRRGAAAP